MSDIKVETLAEEMSLTAEGEGGRKVVLRFRFTENGIQTGMNGDFSNSSTEKVEVVEKMAELMKYAAEMYRQAYAKAKEDKNA